MGYAKPTQARLIDQRARRRATQDLIENHRDEFDALYWQHRNEATAEADEIARKAAEDERLAEHGNEPARLMTGRRKQGETPLDRLDVARCPHCIRHHDRGHVCKSCGAKPGFEVFERVRRMSNNGLSPAQIAARTEGVS